MTDMRRAGNPATIPCPCCSGTGTTVLRGPVGARLSQLRRYSGLKQEQVAQGVELCRSRVAGIEAGRMKVDADVLERFARFYKVGVFDLVRV